MYSGNLFSEKQTRFPGLWQCNVAEEAGDLSDPETLKMVIEATLGYLGLENFEVHEDTAIKTRTPDEPRHQFAGDQFWHHDLMREYDDIGQLITVIACIEPGHNSPTDFLNMIELHRYLHENGVYERLGYSLDDLRKLKGIYSQKTYFEESLAKIDEISLGSSLEQTNSIRKTELSDEELKNVAVPLIVPTQFGDALFIDHERCGSIVDQNGLANESLLQYLRLYTGGSVPSQVHSVVNHKPRQLTVFNRDATLHKSTPGNKAARVVHIGWAVSLTK